MKKVEMIRLIENFIESIKEKYNIKINWEYDEVYDCYDIWHTNDRLQFEDDEFMSFVGQLVRDIFYNNNVYNIGFGYKYYH